MPSDDSVQFNQAAKALGVSRKTIERMVKRGQLERSANGSAQMAAVTKRSLVTVLEQRRGDAARNHDMRAGSPGDRHETPADAVHFDRAARALGVSRKTIERMVTRAELERHAPGPGAARVAAVTKQSLVALMERRAGSPVDMSQLSRDMSRPISETSLGRDIRELVEPLMQQVVDARTQAAELGVQVRLLEERSQSGRQADELLARLATGSWRQRRAARRAYVAKLGRDSRLRT